MKSLLTKSTKKNSSKILPLFVTEMHTYSVLLLATAAGINRYTLETTRPATVVNENTE